MQFSVLGEQPVDLKFCPVTSQVRCLLLYVSNANRLTPRLTVQVRSDGDPVARAGLADRILGLPSMGGALTRISEPVRSPNGRG